MRDISILVTGATSGIGLATVRRLAADGAAVLAHGRSASRVEQVVGELRAGGGRAEGLVADLASLENVARLAEEVAERAPTLDVLVNNAGVGPGGPSGTRELSPDGHELRLTVNYLAPVALTRALLARGLPRRAIVNVSSAGQAPIDFADPMLERRYDGWQAYNQSKLALIMFTFDLAAEVPGVAVNALHPGTFLDTTMVREIGVKPQGTAEDGADSVVALVRRSLAGGVTGRYFDGTRPADPLPQARDPAARRRLRELTEATLTPPRRLR